MKCIGGLLIPSSGRVSWKRNTSELSGPDIKILTGFAAPYVSLYKELSVRENLEFLLRLRKMKTERETLAQLIDKVGLAHVKEQPFDRLSTGQQQRARLASAMLHDPEVLLLDEPGSNLDQNGHELIEELAGFYGSGSRLMILASNNDQELALCDRVFSIQEEAFI
jgi:ABC-type multidrug transport system ATPase subunit